MLTPTQVLDHDYLEARRDLLGMAALLDRYDPAIERQGAPAGTDARLDILRRALAQLAEPSASTTKDRTVALLELFAEI